MVWIAIFLVLNYAANENHPIVENGSEPHGPAKTIRFSSDLRFGGDESGEEYLWTSLAGIEVNAEGHIFVADAKNVRILEFDENGKFQSVVVTHGKGPGEIATLSGIQLLEDGSLAVFEAGPGLRAAMNFYDPDLKFVKRESLPVQAGVPAHLRYSPNGKWLAVLTRTPDLDGGFIEIKSGICDRQLKFTLPITTYRQPVKFRLEPGDTGGFIDFLAGMVQMTHLAVGLTAFGDQGEIYCAASDRYEITKWRPDMSQKLLTIKRQYKPVAFTQVEKEAQLADLKENFRNSPLGQTITPDLLEKVMEKAQIPAVKNPLFGLIAMPGGYLLAVHDSNLATRVQVADLFDPEGRFLGQISLANFGFLDMQGGAKMLFKNGYAYSLESDQNDEYRLTRYQYEVTPK